jgi:hypothetical protein
MAKFKNGRESVVGDKVVGLDGGDNPVSGVLVMIHSLAGRGTENHPDIAVVQSGKLLGDLFAKNFLHADDAKAGSPQSAPTPPPADLPTE